MKPIFCRTGDIKLEINGFIKPYLEGVIEQWLLVAPLANPLMLDMLKERDCLPLREMVPWAGEFAGKYLTSGVQILRLTNDGRLKNWLSQFVKLLVKLQAEDGYLGPWPKSSQLTGTAPNVCPCCSGRTWDAWGHYHVMLGLLLWYEDTKDKRALLCASRIGDILCRKFLGVRESGKRLVDIGTPETNLAPVHGLCILYRTTGKKKYLDLALQIVDEFGAQGKDGPLAGNYLGAALIGKQFYETPKPRWESLHPIMGLAELYWITGDEDYRKAFQHLWQSMVVFDRHNNGGFTSGEKATGNPYDRGAIETCCTIAWLAMSVEMLKITGSSIVADEMELSTLNSVVGMHSRTGRWVTYNTPMDGQRYASNHHIVFQAQAGSSELNCCSVNGPRGFGIINDWALMRDQEGLVVNWYGPSTGTTVLADGTAVKLRQETNYPVSGKIFLYVSPSKKALFVLKLRVPCWSVKTKVKLNGEWLAATKPGTYLSIKRRWAKGDMIELNLDMSLHFWKGERESKNLISVYRGPILLTYDRRYNPEHVQKETGIILKGPLTNQPANFLEVPELNGNTLKIIPAKCKDWIHPLMLFQIKAARGEKIYLCDFGSAGEGGSPYVTWLPVKHGTFNAPEYFSGKTMRKFYRSKKR
ncbi:MAG: beta-L-arabinofuranosidase domain-containing protein [Candidatus Omnitrophota bacterium]